MEAAILELESSTVYLTVSLWDRVFQTACKGTCPGDVKENWEMQGALTPSLFWGFTNATSNLPTPLSRRCLLTLQMRKLWHRVLIKSPTQEPVHGGSGISIRFALLQSSFFSKVYTAKFGQISKYNWLFKTIYYKSTHTKCIYPFPTHVLSWDVTTLVG